MAAWYEALVQDVASAIADALPTYNHVLRPEQMNRRNFLQDVQSEALKLPFALVRVKRMRPAPEYSGAHVAVRVAVAVYLFQAYEGAGGDQTSDVVGDCATLLAHMAGTTQGFTLEVNRSEIDATEETEEAVRLLFAQSLPIVAASLTLSCVTGFAIEDVNDNPPPAPGAFTFDSTSISFDSTGWTWDDN